MTNKTNHILFVSGMSIVFNKTSNINYTGFVKDIWEFNQIAPCPEYLGQYVTGNNGFGFHRKSYVPWFWLWWDRTLWKRNIIWSIQKSLPLLWSIKLYNVNDSNAKHRTLIAGLSCLGSLWLTLPYESSNSLGPGPSLLSIANLMCFVNLKCPKEKSLCPSRQIQSFITITSKLSTKPKPICLAWAPHVL